MNDLVSADSHVVEPPQVYQDYLDRPWREQAPRLVDDGHGGQSYLIPGMTKTVGLGLLDAAGEDTNDLRHVGRAFSAVRPGAWQPAARLRDQDVDMVAAEVLYPTVGLAILQHINREYASACLTAYNRWLAEFCAAGSGRLVGCGASAAVSPAEAVTDLKEIRRRGLSGVVLPYTPGTGSYLSPDYDLLWHTAVDLDLPVSFHALPSQRRSRTDAVTALSPVWDAQELLLELVVGGLFERHPRLRIVLAEFDVGWVPHFLQRLDHLHHRHGNWLGWKTSLRRPPSEHVRHNVWFTFQDDEVAATLDARWPVNAMWSSDFPHAESTWPRSVDVKHRLAQLLPPESVPVVFAERVRALYGI